ncbi:AAA+ ATPase [Pelomyxa schiedti]|nr:AAA+ ATPase [Pelomyxa schiedti]
MYAESADNTVRELYTHLVSCPELVSRAHGRWSTTLDSNYTRTAFSLLSTFDQFNALAHNPNFSAHISCHVLDNFPFLLAMLLKLTEEIPFEKNPAHNLAILQDVPRCLDRVLYHISGKCPSDEVETRDISILQTLANLFQHNKAMFEKLLQLITHRSVDPILRSKTLLLSSGFEMHIQILYLALHYVKGTNENEFVPNWNTFCDHFLTQLPFSFTPTFFNRAPVLYNSLSGKLPASVSISVLQGVLRQIKNELHHCSAHECEQLQGEVISNVFWVCPGGFSIPIGNRNGIQDMTNCYNDLLELTTTRKDKVNLKRLAIWWNWIKWVSEALHLKLGTQDILTANFSKLSLQTGVDVLGSEIPPDIKDFYTNSIQCYVSKHSLSMEELKLLPDYFLDLPLLQRFLSENVSSLKPEQFGSFLDIYSKLLHTGIVSDGLPRIHLLLFPLDFIFSKKQSHYNEFCDFLYILLLCPKYSSHFPAEDEQQLYAMKDVVKNADFTLVSRNFSRFVASTYLHKHNLKQFLQQKRHKKNHSGHEQIQSIDSEIYSDINLSKHQRLSGFTSFGLYSNLNVSFSCEAGTGQSLPKQLNALGNWMGQYFTRFTSPEEQSSIVLAVLSACVSSRFQLQPEELLRAIKCEVDRIAELQLTQNEVKSCVSTAVTQEPGSRFQPDQPSVHSSSSKRSSTTATAQYEAFKHLAHMLFPGIEMPNMPDIYDSFKSMTAEVHHMEIVRAWLIQKAKVSLPTMQLTIDMEKGLFCEFKQWLANLKDSLKLRQPPLHALKYFVVNRIDDTTRDLRQLLAGDIELQKVTFSICSKFFTDKGDTFSNIRILQSALELLQYLDYIPLVYNCCHQYDLCIESVSSLLARHKSLTTQTVHLPECQRHLKEIRHQFGDLEPDILEFFSILSISGDVLEWHQSYTQPEFEQMHALVQATTQGWNFGQELALCAVTSRKPMMVFQQSRGQRNKPLYELCEALKAEIGDRSNAIHLLQNIRSVLDNLAQLKVMFSSQGGLNLEALLPYVRTLREKGCYRSCLSLNPKGQSLVLVIPHIEGSSTAMKDQSHSFLMNLIRAMKIFISSSKAADVENVSGFILLFSLAEEMHEVRLQLEGLGHPQFQGIETFLNEPGGLQNIDNFKQAHTELTRILSEWRFELNLIYKNQPRLNFLSGHQLAKFGETLASSLEMSPVTTSAYRPYLWLCFPDVMCSNPIPHESLLECMSKSISGLGGKPAMWEPILLLRLACSFVSLVTQLHSVVAVSHQSSAMSGNPGSDNHEITVQLAENFSPTTQLYLLFEIFNYQVPHPSLICYGLQATGTELKHFLTCIKSFPHLYFVIVGVNDMSESIRHKLFKWSAKMATQETPHAKTFLIFTSRVGIDNFLNFSVKNQEDVMAQAQSRLTSSPLNPQAILSRRNMDVSCYTGPACSGKSTDIFVKMKQQTSKMITLSVSISECVINMHFDISAYANFAIIGKFFYDFILWGFLCDNQTGTVLLVWQDKVKWNIFVELSASPKADVEDGFGFETTDVVLQHLPVLQYLNKLIPKCTLSYVIDDKAILVSKFLYAKSHSLIDDTTKLVKFLGESPSFDVGTFLQSYFQSTNTPELSNDRMKQHHFVSLLADRCSWLLQYAKQQLLYQQEHDVSKLLSVHQLLFLFESDSLRLCTLTLDVSDQIYIAREHTHRLNFQGITLPTAIVAAKSLPMLTSGKEALPRDLVFTLEEAKSMPARLRQQLQLSFGIEGLDRILRQHHYVLTPDFALKLLLIYDHMKAGQNLILCGGTGTGKTELLTVFSTLTNAHSKLFPNLFWKTKRFVLDRMLKNIPGIPSVLIEQCTAIFQGKKLSAIPRTPLSIPRSPKSTAETALEWLDSSEQFHSLIVEMCNTFNKFFPLFACKCVQYVIKNLKKRQHILRADCLRQMFSNSLTQPEVLEPGVHYIVNSSKELADLLIAFQNAKFESVFHRIRMHQRFTAEQFRARIQHIKDVLAHFPSATKIVCFIDECTSTSVLGMVKEVMCDSKLDGLDLPQDIFFVAALNKNMDTVEPTKAHTQFNFIGRESKLSGKSFAVRAPPLSMEKIIVDFGKLTRLQEESFTEGLISNRFPGKNFVTQQLTPLILMGQDFIKNARIHRVTATIRDIVRAVDLYCYFSSHPQFMTNLPAPETPNFLSLHEKECHWQALALSITMTYYFRLPSTTFVQQHTQALGNLPKSQPLHETSRENTPWTREQFEKALIDFTNAHFTNAPLYLARWSDYTHAVLEKLCKNTVLPAGIAKTNTFMENLFCTVVCLDSRIPLVIVGPPGCSKTLSFTVAVDNMKGTTSPSDFYRSLHHIQPFRYQCSEQSTDSEIQSMYKSATHRQKSFLSTSRELCAVLLDEVGLPSEELSPLKILHFKLDHPKVSSVLLSNRILDEAKTNRTLMLLQSEPPLTDLQRLAEGCIFGDKPDSTVQNVLAQLCVAYQEEVVKFYGSPYPQRFFHLRDFVYFLRYLRKHCFTADGLSFDLTEHKVIAGLKRNFGGLDQRHFDCLVANFIDHINHALKSNNTLLWGQLPAGRRTEINTIKESLSEKLTDLEDPNTAPFRYIMLLDPTENEVAVALLFDLGLCDRNQTTICYVGDFPGDNDQRVKAEVVEKVKIAMELGTTIVLVNSTSVHSSFYDVFNRHYTIMPKNKRDVSKAPNTSSRVCFANLAAGTFSQPCVVHDNFRVIVHVPKSSLQSLPTPLLNRFEKYCLGIDDALFERLLAFPLRTFISSGHSHPLPPYAVLQRGAEHMIQKLHTDSCNSRLFYGVAANETASSFIFSVLQQTVKLSTHQGNSTEENIDELIPAFPPLFGDSDSLTSPKFEDNHWERNMQQYITKVNLHILQLARPEQIVFCPKLPKRYKRCYFLQQEHFSVFRFLKQLICERSSGRALCSKWGVFTRTSAELLQLPTDKHLQDKISEILTDINPVDPAAKADEYLEIINMREVLSSQQCTLKVKEFRSSNRKRLLLCLADLAIISPQQINFLRNEIDEAWNSAKRDTDTNTGIQLAVVLVHFPPEAGIRRESPYDAVFLNNWDFIYIDTLGIAVSPLSRTVSMAPDPQWLMANAFQLTLNDGENCKLSNSDQETGMFSKSFFELLQHFCRFMSGSGLNSCPSVLDSVEAKSFYGDQSTAVALQHPQWKRRYEILKTLFEQHPEMCIGIIHQFSRSWGLGFLNSVVAEAGTEISKGSSVVSLVGAILSSLSHFMAPLVGSILQMMLSSFGLNPIMNMFSDPETAKLQELVHRTYCAIPIPQLSKEDLTSNTHSLSLVISKTYNFPSKLPFYDVISNLINMQMLKAVRDLCHKPFSQLDLHGRMLELIEGNPAIQTLVEHLGTQYLFTAFQEDFVTRTMKMSSLHFSEFSCRVGTLGSTEEVQNRWRRFVDLIIKSLEVCKMSLFMDVPLLFVIKWFFEKEIWYFKELVTPLQLLNPPLTNQEFHRYMDMPKLNKLIDVQNWIADLSTEFLWKRLTVGLFGRDCSNIESIVNWGQVCRSFFSTLLPRKDLSRFLSTHIDTLQRLDAMHVVFSFLCQCSSATESFAFTQNKHLLQCLEEFVSTTYKATSILLNGVLLALHFLPVPVSQASESSIHFLRDVIDYFMTQSNETQSLRNEMKENLITFLHMNNKTLPDFNGNPKLKDYCAKLSENNWMSNFLFMWVESKPEKCTEELLQLAAQVITETKPAVSDNTYAFSPNVMSRSPPPSLLPTEFWIYHFFLHTMDPVSNYNSKQKAIIPIKTMDEAWQLLTSLTQGDILSQIKKAACSTILLKLVAGVLSGTENLFMQIQKVKPELLHVVEQLLHPTSFLQNSRTFFLKSIREEKTLVALLQDSKSLSLLGIADLKIPQVEKPFFIDSKIHPNTKGTAAFNILQDYRSHKDTLLSCLFGCDELCDIARRKFLPTTLLGYFYTNIPVLQVLGHLPLFVVFYQMLNSMFAPVLNGEYLHAPFSECINWVIQNNPGASDCILSNHKKFLNAWKEVHSAFYQIAIKIPEIAPSTSLAELVSLPQRGHGDLIFSVIKEMSRIQNTLVELRKACDSDVLNPYGFTFENNNKATYYNVEAIPNAASQLLISVNCFDLGRITVAHLKLQDGTKSNINFEENALTRFIISHYLADKCTLNEVDSMRVAFPMDLPDNTVPILAPKWKGQDKMEYRMHREINLLAPTFKTQLSPSIYTTLERALQGESEEQIRELMQLLTQLLENFQRDLHHRPTTHHEQHTLAQIWLDLIPNKPIPRALTLLRNQKFATIGDISMTVLTKYKAKQWLFIGMPSEYDMTPSEKLQSTVTEKLKEVMEAPIDKKRHMHAVADAICTYLKRDRIKGNNTALLSSLIAFPEIVNDHISKEDIESLLFNMPLANYCYLMRQLHILCGDLLIAIANYSNDEDQADDEYHELDNLQLSVFVPETAPSPRHSPPKSDHYTCLFMNALGPDSEATLQPVLDPAPAVPEPLPQPPVPTPVVPVPVPVVPVPVPLPPPAEDPQVIDFMKHEKEEYDGIQASIQSIHNNFEALLNINLTLRATIVNPQLQALPEFQSLCARFTSFHASYSEVVATMDSVESQHCKEAEQLHRDFHSALGGGHNLTEANRIMGRIKQLADTLSNDGMDLDTQMLSLADEGTILVKDLERSLQGL